jgi:hypothetical protein
MKEQPKELVDKLKYFIDDSKQFTAARYLRTITENNESPQRR